MNSTTHPLEVPEEAIHRSQRVTWLLVGVVLLSMADLFLTITYLTTVGMSEGNPIAVWLLSATNSVWPLILYKVGTVTVCVSLLYVNRFRRQGELASWCAMLLLVALSTLVYTANAARQSVNRHEVLTFDHGWRFHLGDPSI